MARKKLSGEQVEKLKEEKELLELEREQDEDDNKTRRIVYFIIFIVLLFFSTFGITYSIYKGDTDNQEIVTDKIIFSYSDVNKGGSGINITNAIPISDAAGRVLTGSGQYFDFSITATSKNTDIDYKLLVRKNDISTLPNTELRIYLTKLTGSFEEELVLDDFSNLRREAIDGINYYVLYEKTLNKGIEDYSDFYRLRMWVKEGSTNFDSKIFSLNVDVHAVQGGN